MTNGSGERDHTCDAAPATERHSAIVWDLLVRHYGHMCLHHNREMLRLASAYHFREWKVTRRLLASALEAWSALRDMEAQQ